MSAQKEQLNKFRKQIDDIDNKIISLLQNRLEIVKQVGKHKEKTSATQSFIRAGREATMLRDLTKKLDGQFPPAAIATIWRMIISSSLCTEQDMSISAYAIKGDKTCYWHAREYYGTFVKTIIEDSAEKVINDIASGKSAIGVLPLIDDTDNPWWDRPSTEKNDAYIFARIPFVETDEDIVQPSLAIANVMPEPTENDVSIISVHTPNSSDDIKNSFAKVGLNANIIAQNKISHLIEIDKFIPTDDEILNSLEKSISNANIRLMGSYAVPIKL